MCLNSQPREPLNIRTPHLAIRIRIPHICGDGSRKNSAATVGEGLDTVADTLCLRRGTLHERANMSRTVVVGASSGLGRCIGVGLAQRGGQIALLARRRARIEAAAEEAGPGAIAIDCDVTDEASCRSAFDQAAEALGGIDNII